MIHYVQTKTFVLLNLHEVYSNRILFDYYYNQSNVTVMVHLISFYSQNRSVSVHQVIDSPSFRQGPAGILIPCPQSPDYWLKSTACIQVQSMLECLETCCFLTPPVHQTNLGSLYLCRVACTPPKQRNTKIWSQILSSSFISIESYDRKHVL